MTFQKIQKSFRRLGSPKKGKVYQSFFKTGRGEYGEGDQFIGITVPEIRKFSKTHQELFLKDTIRFLKSPIHEERLLALFILILKYEKGDESLRSKIYKLYLSHTKHINNWDLIDLSAYKIVGPYLENRSRKVLDKLAISKSMWERRIAILSTFHFIRKNDFKDALRISKTLLHDSEDLLHKAVGWMLREIGKRDLKVEEAFLKKQATHMPRTMLRYAIERFPEGKRQSYLKKPYNQGKRVKLG